MGWNDFGYILDGSSMMFCDVQSLANKITNLGSTVEEVITDERRDSGA
jgi:hypothetical protein